MKIQNTKNEIVKFLFLHYSLLLGTNELVHRNSKSNYSYKLTHRNSLKHKTESKRGIFQ